jgi:hypothetical protein
MASLFDTVLEYFDEEGWKYRRLPGREGVELGVAGDHGNYHLVALVDGDDMLRLLTFVEGKVPEARRRDVMEFITRANYGLLLGNFELDINDGELRYKASIDVEDSRLSRSQFRNLLFGSVAAIDRYFPHLQRVLQGAADPAAAVADAEHGE